MSKLNQWLTLVANLSVVAGIVFLAAEMRQNTQAIRAQTRDSITEKQMMFFLDGFGGSPEVAEVWRAGNEGGRAALEGALVSMYVGLVSANLREWENSYFQYEQGLFTEDEFLPRRTLWARNVGRWPGLREVWADEREHFSPSFRTEIDRIVAEVEQAE